MYDHHAEDAKADMDLTFEREAMFEALAGHVVLVVASCVLMFLKTRNLTYHNSTLVDLSMPRLASLTCYAPQCQTKYVRLSFQECACELALSWSMAVHVQAVALCWMMLACVVCVPRGLHYPA